MARLTLEEKIEAAEFIRETYLPSPSSGFEPIPHLFVRDQLGANTWWMQDEIVKSVFKNKVTAVKTCNAVGKAIALDTPLLTTNGWTTMADVKIGDEVFSPSGKPVKVTHVHPVRERETYRIRFDNKTAIIVDGDHLWTTLPLNIRHRLKSRAQWANRDPITDWRVHWLDGITLSTREMAEHVKSRGINNYLVPTTRPLNSAEREYELDPYVFGAWLGDGYQHATVITKPDIELRQMVANIGHEVRESADRRSFNFWPHGDGQTLLKRLGVYRNKHIPIHYMLGSHEQRLALLRGLMDTDGYCGKKGEVELCFTNQRLSEDAASLIASLGWKVAVTESDAKLYGRFISRRWRIHFRADVCPFKLSRKADLWHQPKAQASKSTGHLITAIEKVETVPTRCITVANDDGLFLIGRQLIPTHNSFIAARIIVTYLTLLPGSIVVTTAPTWRQVTDILWREIAITVKKSKIKLTDNDVRQAGLDIDKDWYAVGLSTKYPENFFGYHANNILVVVDEAGGVPDQIFKGVKAITPNRNARILYIGNPTNPSGTFYDAFNNPKLPIKRFTISAFQTPNFTANGIRDVEDLLRLFTPPPGVDEMEHVIRVNDTLKLPYDSLIDPSAVYERYWEWGVDSPAWESLIMGEFPTQAEQALIPVDLVKMSMQMYGTDPDTGKTYAELSGWNIPTGPPEYGLDVARNGPDLNVLTPRRGGWVEEQVTWNKKAGGYIELDETADRVLDIIDPQDFNLRLNLDDTALGGGVTATLNRVRREVMQSGKPAHQYQLVPYNMASKEFMIDPNRFNDITSELYWNLRTWFYKKQIALHDEPKLFNELVGRRWGVNKQNGKIMVEKKDDYKKRTGGRSPDRSDSLAMAYAGGDRTGYTRLPQSNAAERKRPAVVPITSGVMQRF